MVKENARKYDALTSEYEEVKKAYDKVCKEKAYKTGKAIKMRAYLEAMKQANTYLDEWSNEMWVLMVTKSIVNRDGSIKFEFMNGQEVTIENMIEIDTKPPEIWCFSFSKFAD